MHVRPTESQQFELDIEYFDLHRDELLQGYPNMWIAIFEQAVVGADRDVDRLLAAVRSRGVPPEHTLIKHMRRDEVVLILPL